jgi:NAD-dependent DNA ligase
MEPDVKDLVMLYFRESYKYYVSYEDNDISDAHYDQLCHRLLQLYPDMAPELKELLDPDLLSAGSGYSISMDTYRKAGVIE